MSLLFVALMFITVTNAGKCDPPDCKNSANDGLKFPHYTSIKYWLCQYNQRHEMVCGAGFAFHALRRQCVHASVWEDYCGK